MTFNVRVVLFILFVTVPNTIFGREWSDKTGNFSVKADFVAYSDTTVVVEKENNRLVAIPIEQLSEGDRTYLKTKVDSLSKETKVLKLKSGLKLPGQVVGFDKHGVTIQRRRGRVYVDNQRFDDLPGVYRAHIPKLVEHFTSQKIDGEKGLKSWVRAQRGTPRTFECAGVTIELEDQLLYCIPFFLLDKETFAMLKPGWDLWLAAKEDHEEKERQSFLIQAQAQAISTKMEADEQERIRSQQVQQLQLNLQAYDAGLFDLWEVAMYPQGSNIGMPLSVVVPATDSVQAGNAAQRRNPSYVVGEMRVVRRRE